LEIIINHLLSDIFLELRDFGKESAQQAEAIKQLP